MAERAATRKGQARLQDGGASIGTTGQGSQFGVPNGTDGGPQGRLGREHLVRVAGLERGSEAFKGHGQTSEGVRVDRHGPG